MGRMGRLENTMGEPFRAVKPRRTSAEGGHMGVAADDLDPLICEVDAPQRIENPMKSACSGTNQGVVWFQAEHTRALVASCGPILTHSRPDPATRRGYCPQPPSGTARRRSWEDPHAIPLLSPPTATGNLSKLEESRGFRFPVRLNGCTVQRKEPRRSPALARPVQAPGRSFSLS